MRHGLVSKLLIKLGMKNHFLPSLCSIIAVAFAAILFGSAVETRAQTAVEAAQDRAEELRLKLDDLKARQVELQDQLANLDEQMDPQNIENSLAGVGSTRPEDLRELRRRQLERQKIGIQNKLNILADSQSRVETAIAEAEADAYYESAGVDSDASAVADTQVRDSRDGFVAQSNDKFKTSGSAGPTERSQTRPRRAGRSVAKQASRINNP